MNVHISSRRAKLHRQAGQVPRRTDKNRREAHRDHPNEIHRFSLGAQPSLRNLPQRPMLRRARRRRRTIGTVQRRHVETQKLVVAAYVVLSAVPFGIAATHHAFWERAHSTAPVSTVIFLAVLLALAAGRRWAWLLLVLFEGFVLLSFAWNFSSVISFALVLLSYLLLISRPMRRHVRRHNTAQVG